MQMSTSSWRVTLKTHSPLVACLQVMPKHRPSLNAFFTCKSGVKTTMWPDLKNQTQPESDPQQARITNKECNLPLRPLFWFAKVQMKQKLLLFPTSLASGTFFKFGEFPVLHFKNHALEALAVSWLAKLPLSDWRRDLQEKERGY